MSIIREALQEAQSSEQVTPNELRKTGSRASVQGPEFGLMPSLAEDIRALRENMEIISNGGKIKVIGITSGASQEGTSTIAAFLAVSIGNGGSTNGAAGSKNSASKNNSGSDASQAVKNVLLIDANLRRPTLHSILGLKIRPGLNDVLERRASWPEALQNVNNGALNVLTAGTPCINPGDALSSSRMNRLLKELRDYYKKIRSQTFF